jgi:protein O-mannosyl-transferase
LVVLLIRRLLSPLKETARIKEQSVFLNERTTFVAAGITGLLFGLHPVHVESVAWIAERKDLLCALFFLLSILMYICYVRTGNHEAFHKDSISWFFNKRYLFTIVLFILALLSKPMAVTLPVVLLILDWSPLNRIRSWKTLWAACSEKLPFLVLVFISSILTILAQRSGDALQPMEFAPLSTRVMVAAKSIIAYLGKLIWPLNLIPFYPYPQNISPLSLEYLLPIVLVFVITIVCLILTRKHRIWLSVWGYYVVTLIPVLGIVQVGTQSMADRYTYLPSIGPFYLMGLGVAWVLNKIDALAILRLFGKIVSATVVIFTFIFLSYLTFRQIDIWKNGLSLWTYVIEKDPGISRAYNNRGLVYVDMGQFDKATEDFNKAITLNPTLDIAYNNRGVLFGRMGRFDNAIEDFEKAIALNPSFSLAFNNLGINYAKVGLFDKALEQFNKAIKLNQGLAMAYYNRGLLSLRTGNKELAVSDYQKACNLGNDNGCSALQQLNQGLHSQ